MTSVSKYSLAQMNDISNMGFSFEMSEETYNLINYLCSQVGSTLITTRVRTKIVTKRQDLRRRPLRQNEQINGNWESVRSFKTTKLEQNTGCNAELDQIRLLLNKLTDKSFLDVKDKIMERINNICLQTNEEAFINKMGTVIYDICSTNKFYSKIFADLFAELATIFGFIRNIFNDKYSNFPEQYNDMTYVDPNKDYDGFCEMNKKNERRRAITTFYLNLALNNFIKKEDVVNILKKILTSIMNMINMSDKKNEVDELSEIIGILFNKEMIDEVNNNNELTDYNVLNQTIFDTVSSLAQKKAKDYPSLSNKAIFKYMDLVEM